MRFKAAARRLALVAWAGALAVAGAALAQTADPGAFQKGLEAYLNGEYQAALQHWRPAAESGDAVAAFNVGVLLAQGLGVETDHAAAVRWYRKSAHAGYANAQFNLGAAYYNGEGTEVNLPQAVSWWEKAAAQDHPEALYNLATLYRRGNGVPRDAQRAVSLFSKAAALGDARAREALTEMGTEAPAQADRATGQDAASDRGAAGADDGGAPQAPAPAVTGNPLADENPDHWTVQLFAGTEAQAARGFAREHGLADSLRIYAARIDGKTWYKGIYGSFADRAEAGAARDRLARRLSGTDPWLRSYRSVQAEAVDGRLLAAGTPAGDASGQMSEEMARASEPAPAASTSPDGGAGTTAAAVTAADDTQPAAGGSGGGDESAGAASASGAASDDASSGSPSASGSSDGTDQSALGEGQKAFNAQDYAKAMAAWRPLAEQGVAEAQYGVGFMYESGWGVERDFEEAFRWYQQAAQQGHVKAQYNLGMLYRNGRGVAQNDALGLYWIQSAADRGDERAQGYLEDLN